MSMFDFLFSEEDQRKIGEAYDAALAAAFPTPIPEWAKRKPESETSNG